MRASPLRQLPVMLVMLLVSGCAVFTEYGRLESDARRMAALGKYDEALVSSARAAQLKPDAQELQDFMKSVYASAVETHEANIRAAKASAASGHWDTVVSENQALLRVAETITSLPAWIGRPARSLDMDAISADISNAKLMSAEDHYQEGVRLAAKQEVDSQRRAVREFSAAQRYATGYKDSASRANAARSKSIKRIAFMPFENTSGRWLRFSDVAQTVEDGAVATIMRDAAVMEFLQIISRADLESVIAEQEPGTSDLAYPLSAAKFGKLLGVHEVISGKITNIAISPARTSTNIRQFHRDICISQGKRPDAKPGDPPICLRTGVAKAFITEYERHASVTISASYRVVDVATGRIKEMQQVTGTCTYFANWERWSGDLRAMNGRDPKEVSNAPEKDLPAIEEMIACAERDLGARLGRALSSHLATPP